MQAPITFDATLIAHPELYQTTQGDEVAMLTLANEVDEQLIHYHVIAVNHTADIIKYAETNLVSITIDLGIDLRVSGQVLNVSNSQKVDMLAKSLMIVLADSIGVID
jgi:CRISPR/Cas system-associated exonuclease Cas4 (RecB family)